MHKRLVHAGFTIVELLIVIVVIGILAGIVLNVVTGTRSRARIAVAESELGLVDRAIAAMVIDTTKWPNGCTPGLNSNPEVFIELANAGLTEQPSVGVIDANCEWTSSDVNNWQGPYVNDEEIIDPWDNSYVFDPDYYPYRDCSSESELPVVSVIVSYGEDGIEYTCDDIYRLVSN